MLGVTDTVKRSEAVIRPWGSYTEISRGSRYKVKELDLLPNSRISMQFHHHRSEHWFVVSGTAEVTLDGVKRILAENSSIFIPLGAIHCLANPGIIPLKVVEVQYGAYLEEDDIVRLDN